MSPPMLLYKIFPAKLDTKLDTLYIFHIPAVAIVAKFATIK